MYACTKRDRTKRKIFSKFLVDDIKIIGKPVEVNVR